MFRNLIFATLAGWALLLLATPDCVAQSSRASWDCLPEQTVVAMRIPNGMALAEAIQDTKFGQVLFSEQRKQAISKILEEDDSEEWAEFLSRLKEYDLTAEDLIGLLSGESGYALTMLSAEDAEFAGLAWLQPGEAMASKVVELIARLIEEQDDDRPILRVDTTLADLPVMQLQVPSIKMKYDDKMDVGDDYDDLPYDEKRKVWQDAYEKWKETGVETVFYHNVFVCQLEDRLLFAHNYEAQTEEQAAATAEQLSELFGQWIADHAGDADGFPTKVAVDVGVARAMSLEGLPVFELVGDAKPLIALLSEKMKGVARGKQWFRILGLENLGPFGMRSTVDAPHWRTQVAISVPAPRQGVLQVLDQEALEVDPPQWVPASAVRYYQWSFDLGRAYEVFKEVAQAEFPEKSPPTFSLIETQVQNFTQASLTEVLSSFGNRHTIVSFGLDPEAAEKKDSSGMERMAAVWQVEDEELWSRILKAITPFAKMAPGAEFTEEQNFSGWRIKNEKFEGGLVLGNGYLVLSYGTGVTETILAALNNPPTGSNALVGSDLYERASEMIDLEPALAVEITDGDRYMSMLHGWIQGQLSQFERLLERLEDDDSPQDRKGQKLFFSLARAVMPSAEEIEDMMGVIVSRWEVNDDGIFGNSAQEMPAE